MSQLLSGKVRVVRPQDVSDDRYEYLSLQEAEPNLGVPPSGSIQSGSVALIASDIDGNRLFITKIQLEEFSGSFSGSFEGDGSKLNNLPFSSQLISGSASASIAPNTGFLVNVSSSFDGDMDINGDVRVTGDLYVDNRIVAREIIVEIISSSIIFSSGSNRFGNTTGDLQEFTGSVDITGSLELSGSAEFSGDLSVGGDLSTNNITASVVSSSAFIGDGSQLFNLPAAEQSSRIVDGAVTASVDDENGFIVTSIDSGSQFTGSLFVSGNIEINSGSSFSGSGANLFDIPKAALTPDALLSSFIVSGSVTASVDPNIGFRLEGTDRAEFSSSLFVSGGVSVISGSTFSGSGENLFDIPFSALSTDAVTLPLTINDDNNASGVKAAFGISNNLAPLPLNTEPDVNLTSPLNVEPLSVESTINPSSLSTEAVTAPSAILDDCSAAGRLNNWLPSPMKADDDTIDAVTLFVDKSPPVLKSPLNSAEPLSSKEPVIPTEPVNSCKSPVVLPNLFEPDENIIEDEIISTIISLATILLSTYKSPVTLTSPSISISPSNDEDTLTKNPVFGAIDADAEPLINWLEKGRLFSLEPSPSNEPENEPLNSSNWIFVINKRFPSISEAISATEPLSILPLNGNPKLGSASPNDRYSYLSSETSCGRTTLTLPLNNWLIYYLFNLNIIH